MLIDQNRIELKVYNSGYDECILRAGKTQAGRPADILAGSLVVFKDNVYHKEGEATHPGQVYYPSEGFCTPLYDQLTLTRTVPVPASEGGGEQVDGHDDAYYRYRYEVEDHDTFQFEEDKQAIYDITSFYPAIILENALQGLGINHKNHNGELVLCRELLAGDVYLMRAVKGRYLPTDRMYAVQTEDGIWVTNEVSLPSGATLGMFIGYCQEVYEVTDEMLDVDERPIVDRSNREWSDQSMNGRFVNLVKVRVAKTRMTTPRVLEPRITGGGTFNYNGGGRSFTFVPDGVEDGDVVTATLTKTIGETTTTETPTLENNVVNIGKMVGDYSLEIVITRGGETWKTVNSSIKIKAIQVHVEGTIVLRTGDSESYSYSIYDNGELKGVVDGDDVTFGAVLVTSALEPEPEPALEPANETKQVGYTLTGGVDKDNYYLYPTVADVDVYKYPPITWIDFTEDIVTYDGDPHSVSVSAQEGDTVVYSYNGSEYQSELFTFTDANETGYDVDVRVSHEGYTDLTGSVKLIIRKANQKINAPDYSDTYNGQSQPLLSGNGGRAVSYRKGDSGSFVSGLPYVKNVSDSGTYYLKVDGDRNYKEWTGSVLVAISAAELSVSDVTIAAKNYGEGTEATVTIGTVNGKFGSDDVTVSGSGTFPSADADTYDVTVTYSLSGNDASNYLAPDADVISATINPATIDADFRADPDKEYDTSGIGIYIGNLWKDDLLTCKINGVSHEYRVPTAGSAYVSTPSNVGEYLISDIKVVRYKQDTGGGLVVDTNYATWTHNDYTARILEVTPTGISYDVYANGGEDPPATTTELTFDFIEDNPGAFSPEAISFPADAVFIELGDVSNLVNEEGKLVPEKTNGHYTLTVPVVIKLVKGDTGIFTVKAKISASGVVDTPVDVTVYTVMLYWGIYPSHLKYPVGTSSSSIIPTAKEILEMDGCHRVIGALDNPPYSYEQATDRYVVPCTFCVDKDDWHTEVNAHPEYFTERFDPNEYTQDEIDAFKGDDNASGYKFFLTLWNFSDSNSDITGSDDRSQKNSYLFRGNFTIGGITYSGYTSDGASIPTCRSETKFKLKKM